jgi:hypothetical protein
MGRQMNDPGAREPVEYGTFGGRPGEQWLGTEPLGDGLCFLLGVRQRVQTVASRDPLIDRRVACDKGRRGIGNRRT